MLKLFKQLALYSNRPTLPKFVIAESDLKEEFIRSAAGPGGQKTNKSANCVSLIHIPTNTRVKCHQSRSLEVNRAIARQRMTELIEQMERGKDSKIEKRIEKARKRNCKKAKRAREKYHNEDDKNDAKSQEPSWKQKLWNERFAAHLEDPLK